MKIFFCRKETIVAGMVLVFPLIEIVENKPRNDTIGYMQQSPYVPLNRDEVPEGSRARGPVRANFTVVASTTSDISVFATDSVMVR